MANDPILQLLGLARKAGRLEAGEEPVGAACRAHQARLVLLASDAASNTSRRAAHFGEAGSVLWLTLPFSKAELGALLGRSSCAMLALTDFGLAASVVEKLVVRDPDRYGPAAQQLRVKADRVLQRQKEQRRHEKNLREKKQKPWAPPPKQTPKADSPRTKAKLPLETASPRAKAKRPGQADSPRAKAQRPSETAFPRAGAKQRPAAASSNAQRHPKPKPPGQGTSAPHAKDGFARPGGFPKSGPGGRRLSGKFRHNP